MLLFSNACGDDHTFLFHSFFDDADHSRTILVRKNVVLKLLGTEIFNKRTAPNTVLDRESYWKDVLDTRAHGLNDN